MKRLMIAVLSVGLVLVGAQMARAVVYTFQFSEEDLYNHTQTSNTRLYAQDAPRRNHIVWKTDVQTTDSAQGNVSLYDGIAGTDGFFQTATYDAWLATNPKDPAGNALGLTAFNLQGSVPSWVASGSKNGPMAWGEQYLPANGTAAWTVLASPTGWTGTVVHMDGAPADRYTILWSSVTYDNRLLMSTVDGNPDSIFRFSVDIIGDADTVLNPADGNPFESDGRLRIWFGGDWVYPDNSGNEGYDGVMTLAPVVPEPGTIIIWSVLGAGGWLGMRVARRRRGPVGRQPWSNENRTAIREIIAHGAPR